MSMHYVTGWNRAGYLPDEHPVEYSTFESAVTALIGTLDELLYETADEIDILRPRRHDDQVRLGMQYNELSLARVRAAQWQAPATEEVTHLAVFANGYEYWIHCVLNVQSV